MLRAPRTTTASPIKHVVLIVQENRSFDNLFVGFPKARWKPYGYMHDGTKIALHATNFNGPDVAHWWRAGIQDWDNGKMDGFDTPQASGLPPEGTYPYAHLAQSLTQPYWIMAHRYVLADEMFPPDFDQSFIAHLVLIAGTANIAPQVSLLNHPNSGPYGCDAPAGSMEDTLTPPRFTTRANGPFPCFTQIHTMADTLDAAGISWKYYAPPLRHNFGGPIWSEFDAIKNVRYGPDWNNMVSPETRVLTDAKNGKLPGMTWVIPDYYNSDHGGSNSDTGPSWVAAVVNAIGSNRDEWNSTAIVVLWDDWGGWYDDAVPPQLDFRGLGIRVGCIIISPYAKAGYISHTQYEFGSVLKFAEEQFGIPALGTVAQGYTDARATSISDSFDFTQAPRAFVPIPAKYPASHFLNRAPSNLPPDD